MFDHLYHHLRLREEPSVRTRAKSAMEQYGCEDPLSCWNLGVRSPEGEREGSLGNLNRYRNGADPARHIVSWVVNLSPSDPDLPFKTKS